MTAASLGAAGLGWAPVGRAACTSTSSFWAAPFMRVSKLATQALKSTWAKTSGMAVTKPIAVAASARPMSPPWLATSRLSLSCCSSVKVPIILITVPSRPTMVAILAMARMTGSRKFRSGRISSSMTLAIARRMADRPCFEVSSPATNSLRGITPFVALQSFRAPSTPSFSSRSCSRGRKAFRSVRALKLSMIRQTTRAMAATDIRIMGIAK
jgi:hypothetical protein